MLQALIDGASASVPAIWKLEVVNALVVSERRKKITADKTARFIRNPRNLPLLWGKEGLDQAFDAVLDLARKYRRSTYNASYLELSLRRQIPLATRDEPLHHAAEPLGIDRFQP